MLQHARQFGDAGELQFAPASLLVGRGHGRREFAGFFGHLLRTFVTGLERTFEFVVGPGQFIELALEGRELLLRHADELLAALRQLALRGVSEGFPHPLLEFSEGQLGLLQAALRRGLGFVGASQPGLCGVGASQRVVTFGLQGGRILRAAALRRGQQCLRAGELLLQGEVGLILGLATAAEEVADISEHEAQEGRDDVFHLMIC